jgi:hypothetical protein
MVGGGNPGRLRNGRGVGDVFTQWKMYTRKARVAVRTFFLNQISMRSGGCVFIEVNCYVSYGVLASRLFRIRLFRIRLAITIII